MPSKDRHRGLAMFYNHADKDRVTSEGVVVLLLSRCIVLLTYARAPSFLFGRVARSSLRLSNRWMLKKFIFREEFTISASPSIARKDVYTRLSGYIPTTPAALGATRPKGHRSPRIAHDRIRLYLFPQHTHSYHKRDSVHLPPAATVFVPFRRPRRSPGSRAVSARRGDVLRARSSILTARNGIRLLSSTRRCGSAPTDSRVRDRGAPRSVESVLEYRCAYSTS